MVDSRDLTDYKVGLIEENIERTQTMNIRAYRKDATILDKESIEKADIVLADVPCSGLGVIGKKTDIKYRTDEDKIQELSVLSETDPSQCSILCKTGRGTDLQYLYDHPGGKSGQCGMVYGKLSVCTRKPGSVSVRRTPQRDNSTGVSAAASGRA